MSNLEKKLNQIEELFSDDLKSLNKLRDFTKDKNYEVRMKAYENIGDSELELSEKILRNGLSDKHELVRITCVEELEYKEDKKSLQYLIRIAEEDESSLVRRYAIHAIGFIGDRRALPFLKKQRYTKNRDIRVFINIALYLILDSDIFLKKFLDGLNEENYQTRCAVANSIIELEFQDSERMLILEKLKLALSKEKTIAASSSIKNAINCLYSELS